MYRKLVQVKTLGGGFRRGFEGATRIALKDFGITKDLGPASAELDLIFNFEGVKK